MLMDNISDPSVSGYTYDNLNYARRGIDIFALFKRVMCPVPYFLCAMHATSSPSFFSRTLRLFYCNARVFGIYIQRTVLWSCIVVHKKLTEVNHSVYAQAICANSFPSRAEKIFICEGSPGESNVILCPTMIAWQTKTRDVNLIAYCIT